MTEALETLGNSEIGKLSHDFTYYRYLMNRGQMREAFRKISIPEYIALHRIAVNQKEGINSDGRTYLKDLAEKMQLNIHQTSRMSENCRNKVWSIGPMMAMEVKVLM